ncbi:hypothetical protein lerEdw1_009647 [Lerista edwardsae]|nr:hypothetical protein lerEdw1_009647 [Lerista edwardsae]
MSLTYPWTFKAAGEQPSRLHTFDVLLPFEFKTVPAYSDPNYLANVLSMEIAFFTSGLLFAVLLKRWVWDYALTITLGHVLMTFAGEFKPDEHQTWWVR